ncbi:MAG: HAMP domain-containing histidine kinase [Sphingobacteriales bacterium]|nr:MAG: HAMP domain-containing histidine kinase [Sphingobacteriales bacterium]
MQIRYRITLVYTIIVTVILLLLCTSVYFASSENRSQQFRTRVVRKGINTGDLLFKYGMPHQTVREINETAPSALLEKSIVIYDSAYRQVFAYADPNTEILHVGRIIFDLALTQKHYFLQAGDKDAAAIAYRHNGATYVIVSAAYDGETAEWLPTLRFVLAVAFFVSISIVIVTGYIFSLRLVRSISDLTNKVNHISSQELRHRLPVGNQKDELQQLAFTINNLLDRLQSSFDTQRRFIDNASHELSTPLASIGSQIDVALQRHRDESTYRNVLSSINDDINRLNLLIKSLLEMAKLSGSVKGLDLFPVRIDELIMRLPSDLKKVDSRNEVRMIFGELPEDEDELLTYGNEELIFSALRNIAHNACKYSGNFTATVTLNVENDKIVITIADQGPGIAPEEQQRIFQPFYRSADINNKISGFGLGLPLAYQIVKLYNGEIKLQSKLGEGSIFTIILPVNN